MAKSRPNITPRPIHVSANLQRAIALHQQGNLAEAHALYAEVLRGDPANFDALHLSGVIAAQRGQATEATELIGRALRCDPRNRAAYAAHANMASALRILGKAEAALASYDRSLTLEGDYLVAHAGRADLLIELGQWEAAVAAYDQALRKGLNDAAAHRQRAHALCSLGRWGTALASFDRAIALGASGAALYSDRGAVLSHLERWDEALLSCERAIAMKPDHAEAHGNLGNALKQLKRPDEALESYERAIALRPDVAGMHSNRSAVLVELRRWREALAACDQAIALDGGHAEAYLNRGLALHGQGLFDAAAASYDRAIALRADYAEAYSNRGNALTQLGQFGPALESYERALTLRPVYPEARCNRALTLLLLGRFTEGWSDYEWRWASRHGSNIRERRAFAQPLWRGVESLANRRILLHAEQGLGDTIQFCRYIQHVADRGATVFLEVQPALVRLLSTLPRVRRVCARGDALPEFDLQCPLLSLPLAFGTELHSIPRGTGFLRAESALVERWRARLGERTRPRIGIVWSGSSLHHNDHNRSIPLALLLSHLPVDFQYVALQTAVRPSDRASLEGNSGLVDFGAELGDFSDTAALCECLDMVISVDTSVAHLSGAFGKPTWILLPHIPDWRWLLGRTDTPWYPAARLYRQEHAGDWHGVLERVAADLRQQFSAGARR